MPATSKSALISVTEKEYSKLQRVIAAITPAQATLKDKDDTSIKDVIAHRAHWITLFLGWYQDGQRGKDVHFPAPGYKWNDLKRYNADLRAKQHDLSWAAACEMLEANNAQLLAFLKSLSENALYGGPMKGANNAWTPGRWAEAAGPSHYRSAAKYIRARLRAQARNAAGHTPA